MELPNILVAIFAAMCHGTAFIVYNIQVRDGSSSPNPASWAVWAFLSLLNTTSYLVMSDSWLASAQFLVGMVGCCFTFLKSLVGGKFSPLEKKEWRVLAIGLLAAVVWWKFKNAAAGNMIILLAAMIGFWPTLQGVWANPFKEKPFAWKVWSLAFLLSIINLVSMGAGWITFVTPGVLLIAHFTIAVLSADWRKNEYVAEGCQTD